MTMLAHATETDIIEKTLPNGVKWLHKPVRHNQIVAVRLFFPGGSTDESPKKSGLTDLMTSVMFKGTTQRTALQIAQEVESLGASMGAGSEEDYWEMSGQVIADRLSSFLDIFADILFHPTFPPEEFEKEKQAHLNGIQTKKESIFTMAYERLNKELFGPHPYGRPDSGTTETVTSLKREDLVAWHKDRINLEGAVLVTVGNLSVKKMERLLTKSFSAWKIRPAARQKPRPIQYPVQARLAEESHSFEQSYLMLAYPAPPVTSADYPVVKVINSLLGSGMSSPLFQVVREEAGLAYEVSSFYATRRWGSAYTIYAGTDPKNLEKALQKIQGLIKRFLEEPSTEKDLADAKRQIRGRYLMDHQTNSRMAWYLGWWEILGHGYKHDVLYSKEIQAVTADDVKRTAEHLFVQPSVTVKIHSKK